MMTLPSYLCTLENHVTYIYMQLNFHLFSDYVTRNSVSGSSDDDDDVMKAIYQYEADPRKNIEKSLTNFNVNTAIMKEQVLELNQSHKQFCINFVKQQELLLEELGKLRIEGLKIREEIKKSM